MLQIVRLAGPERTESCCLFCGLDKCLPSICPVSDQQEHSLKPSEVEHQDQPLSKTCFDTQLELFEQPQEDD